MMVWHDKIGSRAYIAINKPDFTMQSGYPCIKHIPYFVKQVDPAVSKAAVKDGVE